METEEVTVIEILTVQEGHVDEAREMLERSVALFSQIPGVRRAWGIQDQGHPEEFAFVGLLDAARLPDILRESNDADWHKAMLPRWGEILVRDRFRRIIGPGLR